MSWSLHGVLLQDLIGVNGDSRGGGSLLFRRDKRPPLPREGDRGLEASLSEMGSLVRQLKALRQFPYCMDNLDVRAHGGQMVSLEHLFDGLLRVASASDVDSLISELDEDLRRIIEFDL